MKAMIYTAVGLITCASVFGLSDFITATNEGSLVNYKEADELVKKEPEVIQKTETRKDVQTNTDYKSMKKGTGLTKEGFFLKEDHNLLNKKNKATARKKKNNPVIKTLENFDPEADVVLSEEELIPEIKMEARSLCWKPIQIRKTLIRPSYRKLKPRKSYGILKGSHVQHLQKG